MSRKSTQTSCDTEHLVLLPPPEYHKSEVIKVSKQLASSSQKLSIGVCDARRPVKTALHQAITDGRLHQARLLSASMPNINFKDINGWTPLMLTCSASKDRIGNKMMRMFLSRGAKVNYKDKTGRTALMIACISGNMKMVGRLMVEDGLELSVQDSDGNTALMHAAMKKDPAALNMILASMVRSQLSVDTRNKLEYTALLLACKLGNFSNAFSLITFGKACPYLRDTEYKFGAREWIDWCLSRRSLAKSVKHRFPHLAQKRPIVAPVLLAEERSIQSLLTKVYKPTMLKPHFSFKSYESIAMVQEEMIPKIVNSEDQDGDLHELIREVTRRDIEHETEQARLYHFRTGKIQPLSKRREIATATLRAAAADSDRRKYQSAITLRHIFSMYALNYHKKQDWAHATLST